MRGHRGYNICPWLKSGKRETCGKSCYCKDHRHKIRNGSRIPRPCLKCGIGIRSQIQLCRGQKDKNLKDLTFYCILKTLLKDYNNYVLQKWAAEEKE